MATSTILYFKGVLNYFPCSTWKTDFIVNSSSVAILLASESILVSVSNLAASITLIGLDDSRFPIAPIQLNRF